MRLRRIESGHYLTPCGRYEAVKVDDCVRSHDGPVWILRHGLALSANAAISKALSFREARQKLVRLVEAADAKR